MKRWPWWGHVLAIFITSRVVTTVIMLAVASVQHRSDRTGEQPNIFEFSNIWDGQWYWTINQSGYPDHIDRDANGHTGESAWAFFPAFPFLLRIFTVFGIPFPAIAPFASLLFAVGAALIFFKLMSKFLPEGSALFATALLCFAPLSTVLQVSYAESMHLFLLFLVLLLLVERRYVLIIPVVLVMAFTRPSGLAFALLMLLHLVQRFVTRKRDPFPWRERGWVVVVGLVSAVAGVAWIFIAWAATGDPGAYTDTELVWRAGYIGPDLLPFTTPWTFGAQWWVDKWWHLPDLWNLVIGLGLLVLLVGGFVAFLLSRPVRKLGPDIRFWLISYALYLLAVFFPQSSTFRLLVPLAPALGALAVPKSRIWRAGLLLAGVIGQALWTYWLWRADLNDWTPP